MKWINVFVLALFATISLNAEESQDIVLGDQPNAFTLTRGALQVSPFTRYISLDIADALGFDIDNNQAQGVGQFSEFGIDLKFGLADTWQINYMFSLSDFAYGSRDSEVSTQDVKVKKSFGHWGKLGHVAWEFGWQRHSMNELFVNGSELALSNVLHDFGYQFRVISSRPFFAFDLNTSFAYAIFPEDGDNGQNVWDITIGLSRFWNNVHQLDFTFQHYRINRDSPNFSTDSKSSNNTFRVDYRRHLNDRWIFGAGLRLNDDLFRGIWPFLDREIDKLNFSRYGYFHFNFTYRYDYTQ